MKEIDCGKECGKIAICNRPKMLKSTVVYKDAEDWVFYQGWGD
jgi:hypothetical protein